MIFEINMQDLSFKHYALINALMRYFKQMSITTTIIIVTQIMAHEFKSLFKLIVFFFLYFA